MLDEWTASGRAAREVAGAAWGDQPREALERALADRQGPELAGQAPVAFHAQAGRVHQDVAATLGLDLLGQLGAGIGCE